MYLWLGDCSSPLLPTACHAVHSSKSSDVDVSNIMVTSEVNGADTLEFKLPFRDSKRPHLDNEKQVQIVNDVYRIRTLTDDKGADGKVVTSVYAEAAFYDLAFSVEKAAVNFNADTAEAPMAYAPQGPS